MTTLKSILAVFAGIVTVFLLSHVTDYILEKSGFMLLPFDSNPMWVKLFVTFYRTMYVVAGSYVAATLAPNKPMKHSFIYGAIGCVLGTLGAIAMWNEPPHWYPIALVLLGIPAAWLGGKLKVK